MFASQNLRRIARENGVEVTDETTPNDVIDALRSRAISSDNTHSASTPDARAADGAEKTDVRCRDNAQQEEAI